MMIMKRWQWIWKVFLKLLKHIFHEKWHTLVQIWIFHFFGTGILRTRATGTFDVLHRRSWMSQQMTEKSTLFVFLQSREDFLERNTLELRFYEICQTSESNTFGIQQRNPSLIFTAPIVFLLLSTERAFKTAHFWEINSSVWRNAFGSPSGDV